MRRQQGLSFSLICERDRKKVWQDLPGPGSGPPNPIT
jgi:hypothetical protein